MRRRFSKSQKETIYLTSDGRSEISGKLLNEGWHADHKIPWSKGGKTDVINAQALTPEENIMKSNKQFILRNWQRRFLDSYTIHQKLDYLLNALPAAGKTFAALLVGDEFLRTGSKTRLVVVVPTTTVQNQWCKEGKKHFNIEFQTIEFSGFIKPGYDGVVTTYQAIANKPDLFRVLCNKFKVMAIFDEIHHAGESLRWGESLKHAFTMASERLSLSGTPFRSDGKLIPFLNIDKDGNYKADFTYDYPEALRDGVIRELVFHRWDGEASGLYNKKKRTFHTKDKLSEDEYSTLLRWLLRENDSTFIKGLLKIADARLDKITRDKPDAGGLVLCIDASHALKVGNLLEKITGEVPDIILSDDNKSNSTVDKFIKSDKKWLVAVRMVSEGADIKRLKVLVYLTNTTTNLFFRQAVGRVQRRNKDDNTDTEAYVFFPSNPQLVEHASKIEEFQSQLIDEQDEYRKKSTERLENVNRGIDVILSSSEPEYGGIISRGEHYDPIKSQDISSLAQRHQIPEAKVITLIEELTERLARKTTKAPENELVVTLQDKQKIIRRGNHKLAAKLAYIRDCEVKDIHREVNKILHISKFKDSTTMEQYKDKEAWLLEKIEEEET